MPSVKFCYGGYLSQGPDHRATWPEWKGCHTAGCRSFQSFWNAYALLLGTFSVLSSFLMHSVPEAPQSSDENDQTTQPPPVGKMWACSQEDVWLSGVLH